MIAYSLFSGAGGFELGLEQAGIAIVLASDIDPFAERTHKTNWPDKPFLCADIRQLTGRDLLELAGGRKPDLVVGGPPCQGFSTLGDKLSSDPRNNLFVEFARIVAELEPPMLLMENVKSLVTMYRGRYRQYVLDTFRDLGYAMHDAIVNAASYGVPQDRHRVFFFGSKLPVSFSFPQPTHGNGDGLRPFETVGEWIMDLADKGSEVPGHIPLNHSERVVARYRLISEGGRLPPPDQLPREIRRTNFGNTYKRLHRTRPSLTMVPGNNAFPIHPVLDRSLTPREAARLQTFPDWFVFEGDRRRQCILVGNAVPPRLARAIGACVLEHASAGISRGGQPSPARENSPVTTRRDRVFRLGKPRDDWHSDGFVDLFSGAGGMTIGFAKAGWKPILCVDNDPNVAETHRHNFPSIPFLEADLAEIESLRLVGRQVAGAQVGLVIGGPPCQGFSVFGKRRFVNTRGYDPHSDPRNRLVRAFLSILDMVKPRWFVMENVPGMASFGRGLFVESLIAELASIGYVNIDARVLNAADHGVPQLRRRLLIIGNRTGHVIPWPKRKFFQEPRDWQKPYRSVGEVITDLADEQSYTRQTCHVPMKHKPMVVERFRRIPEGGKLDPDALPDHLREGYRTERIRNYSHVYRRLHRDEPSITLVPGHNAFPIHPWLDRALTVREAARIQTFPDEIEFMGSRQNQCIQVGNAFPPLLAELVANNIRKAETNDWYPGKIPSSAQYALLDRTDSAAPQGFQLTFLGDSVGAPSAPHSVSPVKS